jgi:hypothetical protein
VDCITSKRPLNSSDLRADLLLAKALRHYGPRLRSTSSRSQATLDGVIIWLTRQHLDASELQTERIPPWHTCWGCSRRRCGLGTETETFFVHCLLIEFVSLIVAAGRTPLPTAANSAGEIGRHVWRILALQNGAATESTIGNDHGSGFSTNHPITVSCCGCRIRRFD